MNHTFRNILVVDDHKMNLQILDQMLSDYQTKVACTTNPLKALELIEKNDYDLIISDIQMPELDGYELCKKVKENEKTQNIPIIFITALDSPEDELKALNLGAADFIRKPFIPGVVNYRAELHMKLHKTIKMYSNLASVDDLTNVPNRREYNSRIEVEFNRAKRTKKPLTLIMIDIDYFKLYNDTYGHGLGDKCLQKVASTINEIQKRSTDLFARYGGEEFAMILPETNIEYGYKMASKIKDAVIDKKIPHKASKVSDIVTLSIGVASLIPEQNENFSILEKMSDKQLYKSKENGRNQISFIER